MPIAELLGVQLDMQLLLKLSLSVASVLLVSWAYRFYSSRASRAKACLPPTGDTLPPDAAPLGTGDPPDGGRDRSGGALEGATDGRDLHKNRRSLAHPADAGERTSDRTGRPLLSDAKHRRAGTERAADPARDNREGEAAAQKGPAEGSTGNGSARSDTLSPPGPGEGGPDEASGRHSPCVLQRREPSLGPVGVGRELRQDVDHQGAQSSFLSKAEIQVADAHLVLEGAAADQVVHGKIYDYFVESSSHSTSESRPVLRHNARTSSPDSRSLFGHNARTSSPDSRPVFRQNARTSSPDFRPLFGHHGRTSSPNSRPLFGHYERTSSPDSRPLFGHNERTSSLGSRPLFGHNARTSSPDSRPLFGHNARTSSPDSRRVQPSESPHRGGGGGGGSALSPIIMRDLVLGRSAAAPPSPVTPPEPGPPAKPPLLRKESYLSATEHSQLPVPCLTPGAPAPGSPSQPPPREEPHSVSPGIRGSAAPAARRHPWEDPGLETLAGAPFVQLPAGRLSSPDLEGLKSKLDLGNCMEVLGLAKLRRDEALRAAALRVMSDNYLQVLREPALYGRLRACERDLIRRLRTRGRSCVMVADMDPQDWAESPAAAPEQRRTSSALYYYDDHRDAWHALCPIPREVVSKGCALCTMDNYLFVAVGCQGTEREMIPSKRVFCFNPVTSIWKEISPMNQARPHCRLAAAGGCLYAIGGECLSTVERYDPRADRWTFVAPLPDDTFAVGHRAAVLHGDVYVTGGTLRYSLLRYAPEQDAWRPGVVVGGGDPTADLVALRSFLYRFEVNPRLGVSAYRYHAVARLWYLCGNARLAGVPAFRCVATGDSVYCLGRRFAVRFSADEISPRFCGEPMAVLAAAKGVLFPFVLSLPDKEPVQTSV